MDDNTTYHLIQDASNEEKSWNKKEIKERRTSICLHFLLMAFIYIVVVFVGAFTIVVLEQIPRSAQGNPQVYTPVQDFIRYIPVEQDNSLHEHNPFMVNPATGLPDTTTDEQWEMLYNESMHTSILSALANRLPIPTLPTPNNPDHYLIQLEIYHQLHCLNTIRQALFLDIIPRYRFPHFSDFWLSDDGKRNFKGHGAKHIDHCLDWIRQSLLCNADATPISWQWDTLAQKPLPQLPDRKICKDIGVIDKWTREHAVEEPVDFGFGPDIDL